MPTVVLHPKKEQRVYSGHPWVFRSDIDRVEGPCQDGDVVRVVSSRGRFLAMAVYNPRSQISLRILSRKEEPIDSAFIHRQVKTAIDYRRTFADLNSCRLLFAESDGLPAVIADKFGDIVVLQVLCLGMEQFKQDIVDALAEEVHPAGIYERNDVPVRELEGLTQQTGLLYGTVPDRVEMVENGVHFWVDVKEGQKTGFFLDQKYNRLAMQRICKDMDVLDCFTHTGSFALNAGIAGAKHVLGVDASELAVAQAQKNAALNHLSDTVEFKCADVFDLLPALENEGKQFDVVILDPPAFTKSKNAIKNAVKGYREINLRGMKLVKDGGYLATCSCSHYMNAELFAQTIGQAARAAHCRLRQVEFRTQSPDHPILWSADESYYLKFYIFQVCHEH